MEKNLNVIIVAAGESKRFENNTPKPFIIFNGKPIIWYSAYSFQKCDFVDNIYIVVAKDMLCYAKIIKEKYFKKIDKFKDFIIGGRKRQDSVYNALYKINSSFNDCYVAIHDAARPFLKKGVIEDTYKACIAYQAAAPGIPLVDTIKICDENYIVQTHLKRSNLVAIQTPQIFKLSDIMSAYENIKDSKQIFTDDTEIYSTLFSSVKIVQGDLDLFKITYKNDLKTARAILSNNKKLWK
jgi:2-C-methyl-D-erythritol 4-phosphate cytidylyltransferase